MKFCSSLDVSQQVFARLVYDRVSEVSNDFHGMQMHNPCLSKRSPSAARTKPSSICHPLHPWSLQVPQSIQRGLMINSWLWESGRIKVENHNDVEVSVLKLLTLFSWVRYIEFESSDSDMLWWKSAASLVQMAQKTTKKQRSLSQLVVFLRFWWRKVAVFVQHMHTHAAVLITTEWHMFLAHMIWHMLLTHVSDICALDEQDSCWVEWILAIHRVRYCLRALVATQFWRGQHFQPTWNMCSMCVYTSKLWHHKCKRCVISSFLFQASCKAIRKLVY